MCTEPGVEAIFIESHTNCQNKVQYVREAMDIFIDTGNRHLPEAEATLQEIEEKKWRR